MAKALGSPDEDPIASAVGDGQKERSSLIPIPALPTVTTRCGSCLTGCPNKGIVLYGKSTGPPRTETAELDRVDERGFASIPRRSPEGHGTCPAPGEINLKPPNAKPLRGFGGECVLEVIKDYDGGTYREVYTVKFQGAVYVPHVFQKKSKKGIETPKCDIDLIKARLRTASDDYEKQQRSGKE